jgi:glutathione S-transferase
MIRLLGRQTSGNVQKVIFLLEELHLPYIREDYGRQFGNTNGEAYRALNPNAKVPTLVDGEVVIWESNTILRYLAAIHAPAMAGKTPAERTLVERWMDWQLAAVNPPYLAVFKEAKKPAEERSAEFAGQSADLIAQMKILDQHLAGRTWIALEKLTLAEIALGPIVKRCLEFPIERSALPELTCWQTAIEARPAFAVAIGARTSVLTPAA